MIAIAKTIDKQTRGIFKKVQENPKKISPKTVLLLAAVLIFIALVLLFSLPILGGFLLFLITGYFSFFGANLSVSPVVMMIFYGLISVSVFVWLVIKPGAIQRAEKSAQKIIHSQPTGRRRFVKIN